MFELLCLVVVIILMVRYWAVFGPILQFVLVMSLLSLLTFIAIAVQALYS